MHWDYVYPVLQSLWGPDVAHDIELSTGREDLDQLDVQALFPQRNDQVPVDCPRSIRQLTGFDVLHIDCESLYFSFIQRLLTVDPFPSKQSIIFYMIGLIDTLVDGIRASSVQLWMAGMPADGLLNFTRRSISARQRRAERCQPNQHVASQLLTGFTVGCDMHQQICCSLLAWRRQRLERHLPPQSIIVNTTVLRGDAESKMFQCINGSHRIMAPRPQRTARIALVTERADFLGTCLGSRQVVSHLIHVSRFPELTAAYNDSTSDTWEPLAQSLDVSIVSTTQILRAVNALIYRDMMISKSEMKGRYRYVCRTLSLTFSLLRSDWVPSMFTLSGSGDQKRLTVAKVLAAAMASMGGCDPSAQDLQPALSEDGVNVRSLALLASRIACVLEIPAPYPPCWCANGEQLLDAIAKATTIDEVRSLVDVPDGLVSTLEQTSAEPELHVARPPLDTLASALSYVSSLAAMFYRSGGIVTFTRFQGSGAPSVSSLAVLAELLAQSGIISVGPPPTTGSGDESFGGELDLDITLSCCPLACILSVVPGNLIANLLPEGATTALRSLADSVPSVSEAIRSSSLLSPQIRSVILKSLSQSLTGSSISKLVSYQPSSTRRAALLSPDMSVSS